MNEIYSEEYDIAIIGGGASALYFAAYLSYLVSQKDSFSPSIVLFDTNKTLGKKLLLTGNGRCNLTNTTIESKDYNTDDYDRLSSVLNKHNSNDTINFFENVIGIKTINRNELIYPLTLKSSTVTNGLVNYINESKITVKSNSKIVSLDFLSELSCYILKTNEFSFKAKYVVAAFGGASYPKTGSDGLSYSLFKNFVNKDDLVKLLPSLVQLKTKNIFPTKISGTRTSANIKVLGSDSSILKEENGEILFTDYGISGILVMQISGITNRYFNTNRKYPSLICDLLPELNSDEIYKMIISIKSSILGNRLLPDSLQGILLPEITKAVLEESDLKYLTNRKLSDISDSEIVKLINLLKKVNLRISGSLGFDNAQVTSGGLKLSSLNEDLELVNRNNLFVIGEALNVDGPCGGYNLQWAWSSAVAAARGIYARL